MRNVHAYLMLFGIENPLTVFSQEDLVYIDEVLSFKDEEEYLDVIDRIGRFEEKVLTNTAAPYLDNFVLEKLEAKGISPQSIWPNNHKFSICLTHDIDGVEEYSPKVFKRNIALRFRYAKDKKQKLKLSLDYLKNSVKQLFYVKRDDPMWHFEKWIALEEKFGVKSTYFIFMQPDLDKDVRLNDCVFRLDDTFRFDGKMITVKEYILALDKMGFEIGLHGSILSAEDFLVFQQQKAKLESVIQKPIVLNRQHFLYYYHNITSEIHVRSGIKMDSTIGLTKTSGYRNGTAMPFLIETEHGSVWELPIVLMDSSIFEVENISLEDAKLRVVNYMNQIERVGGCFTVNFHPEYVDQEIYLKLYEFILELGKEKNAYFTTCGGVLDVIESVHPVVFP